VKNAVEDDNKGKHVLETTVNIRTSVKRIPLPPNVIVFQKFAYLAATKLLPSSNQILMLFFSHSAYENYVGMDVKTISEQLNVHERTVIRALKELVEYNVILKLKTIGDARRHDYFINPVAAWKGNSFARKNAIKKIEESNPNQLKMFGESESKPKTIQVNKDF
jgi:predicted transcriptional regulator